MSTDKDKFLWDIKNGDVEAIKKTVSEGRINVNEELSGGRLPIHFAADYGQKDVIEYLISNGAEIDTPDKHGITALCAAVFEDHIECIRILIDKGANKAGKGPGGESYYDIAESEQAKQLLS